MNPHSTHERAILGAILLWGGEAWSVVEQLGVTADDFYSESHQHIYRLLTDALEAGDALDTVRAVGRIHDIGQADRYGGLAYVAALADDIPSIYALPAYCRELRDAAQRRRLKCAGEALVAAAQDYQRDVGDVAADAHLAVDRAAGEHGGEHQADGLALAQLIEQRLTDEGLGPPIPTPWVALNTACAGGLHRGHCWVWGARPRMGKTALALNLAWHAATQGHGVLFCSLEQPRDQVGYRLAAHVAQVPLGLLMERRLNVRDWDRLRGTDGALERIAAAPLWLDCEPAQSLGHVRAQVLRHTYRAEAAGVRLGLVVVDYLQRMRRPRAESRDDAVGLLAMGLADLARDADVAMLILAQLNREVDKRTGQKPEMADLRESGSIEAAADVIVGIHRPGLVVEALNDNSVNLGVLKNRHGQAGVDVGLEWDGPTLTARAARVAQVWDSGEW